MREIFEALGIRESKYLSQVQLALDKVSDCRGLVHLNEHESSSDDQSKTVVLVHMSLKEHLLNRPTTTDSSLAELFFEDQDSHLCIATRCVQYLRLAALPELFWDCDDHRTKEDYPLIEYAIQFWPLHARLSGGQVLKLVDDQKDFFRPKGPACSVWWWSYRGVISAQVTSELSIHLEDPANKKVETAKPFSSRSSSRATAMAQKVLESK